MSSGFQSRSDPKSERCNQDTDIFISGIPVDLEKEGLRNIFSKAGPIDWIKIIPPKVASHTVTYGFIRFKHKAAAALAVETFNNYKIGTKYLQVKFPNQSPMNGQLDRKEKNLNSSFANGNSNERSGVEDDDWTDIIKVTSRTTNEISNNPASFDADESFNRKRSVGRGILAKPIEKEKPSRGFDLSRPYARRLMSRSGSSKNSETSLNKSIENDYKIIESENKDATQMIRPSSINLGKTNESNINFVNKTSIENINASRQKSKVVSKQEENEKFEIGQMYKVRITHVETLSNFFVQLVSKVNQTANLTNNLDNFYRNELATEESKLKKNYEFCSAERSSIRCKFFGIRPPLQFHEWQESAVVVMRKLIESNLEIFAKVYSCDEYDRVNGRLENIYGVDLFYGGDVSVSNFLIENDMAIEIAKADELQEMKKLEINTDQVIKTPQAIEKLESNLNENQQHKKQKQQEQHRHSISGQVMLSAGKSFRVSLQYFDETLVDDYFYLLLYKNALLLEQLYAKLQETDLDENANHQQKQFTYVGNLDDLKVGDELEAMFDLDLKWYRVRVHFICRRTHTLSIYFLDYGNSQTLDAKSSDFLSKKLLRFRNFHINAEEEKLFRSEHQAIKCFYFNKQTKQKQTAVEFTNLLASIPDLEKGFLIKIFCIETDNADRVTYGIDLSDECETLEEVEELEDEETDKEIEMTLREGNGLATTKYSIFSLSENLTDLPNLNVNTEHNVTISHLISTNEFYVQSHESLKELIKNQQMIEVLSKQADVSPNSPNTIYQVGDLVFVKYLCDRTWYRGIVTGVTQRSFKLVERTAENEVIYSSDFEDNEASLNTTVESRRQNPQQDNLVYTIYFVDYGNVETEMLSSNIRSIELIAESLKKKKIDYLADLEALVTFPFQAICCQLEEKKECTRNTEIMHVLMNDCFNFKINVKNVGRRTISATNNSNNNNSIEIRKFVVNLYSDDTLLDSKFESCGSGNSKVTSTKINMSLDFNSMHEVKLACLNGLNSIYLNLLLHATGILSKLEHDLNSESNSDLLGLKNHSYWQKRLPETGDLVLSKFYPDPKDTSNFSWYRGLIKAKKIQATYEVFYIDYGNTDQEVRLDDLRKLPSVYGLENYPPLAFHCSLSGCKDLDNELEFCTDLIDDFLSQETFKCRIIEKKKSKTEETLCNDEFSVELWNNELTTCINSLINSKYIPKKIQKAETELKVSQNQNSELNYVEKKKKNLINESRLDKLISSESRCVMTSHMFIDNFQKPFYFCLADDKENRDKLTADLNAFYGKSKRETCKMAMFNLGDYCAIFSEENWYRAQVKELKASSNQLNMFYIDFGYEELIDLLSIDRVQPLEEVFFEHPRYIFGIGLAELGSKQGSDLMRFNQESDAELANTMNDFCDGNYNEFNLNVLRKLDVNETLLGSGFFQNENYFSAEMYNNNSLCLNRMIQEFNEKKSQKQKCPPLLRLKLSEIPEQPKALITSNQDKFMLFARHVDLFYAYEENRVKKIQECIQKSCDELLQELNKFEPLQSDCKEYLPAKGDLVFGKYDDDQNWYRCIITNCSQSKNKYELFFIDFGNTEINKREDILYGWKEEHVEVFRKYEAQAYKCKLYGIQPLKLDGGAKTSSEFTDAQNTAFKEQISNKIFNVKFIKFNKEENKHEVSLHEYNEENKSNPLILYSTNNFLIEKKIAEYSSFGEILKSVKTQEEIDFYIEQLRLIKLK